MATNRDRLIQTFQSRNRRRGGESPPRRPNVKPGFVPVDQGYAPDKMVSTNSLYQSPAEIGKLKRRSNPVEYTGWNWLAKKGGRNTGMTKGRSDANTVVGRLGANNPPGRITEDNPRWNARTMGNKTGYYKGTWYERGKKARGGRNYNKGSRPG